MSSVLIVFGSQCGSTAEIADTMKDYLEAKAVTVDIMKGTGKPITLSNYGLVVIGSGIYGGKPHTGVREFISVNRAALNAGKVAVFSVSGLINSTRERWRRAAQAGADGVACGLSPVCKTVFAGKIPDLGWFRNFAGWTLACGVGRKDYREWKKIKSWTIELLRWLDIPPAGCKKSRFFGA